MKDVPKVSVVMPVYNGEAFVEKAVRSALAQTHPAIELIAINDGSPDRSIDVLHRFENITVITQKNTGVAGARNRGIEAATGDFVCFLDQDDWWLPEKVAKQLEVFESDAKIGLVHTAVVHLDSETGMEVAPLNPESRPDLMTGDCFQELLLGNPLYNSSVMVRRSVLEDVGGCDSAMAGNTVADYDLWLRIAKNYRFGFVDLPLTCYRMHADQGMHDRRSMLEAELKVLLRIRDEKTWKQDPRGAKRLASLYDSLAVAWYDKGDGVVARRYFGDALRISVSARALVRWFVSLLPRFLVSKLRNS